LQTPSPFGNDTAFILPTGFFLFRLRFVLRGGGPASLNIQPRLYPLGDGDARTALQRAADLIAITRAEDYAHPMDPLDLEALVALAPAGRKCAAIRLAITAAYQLGRRAGKRESRPP
jgi:hypothetical protein